MTKATHERLRFTRIDSVQCTKESGKAMSCRSMVPHVGVLIARMMMMIKLHFECVEQYICDAISYYSSGPFLPLTDLCCQRLLTCQPTLAIYLPTYRPTYHAQLSPNLFL